LAKGRVRRRTLSADRLVRASLVPFDPIESAGIAGRRRVVVYGLCQIYRNEPWHCELRRAAIDRGCPRMYADPTQDPKGGAAEPMAFFGRYLEVTPTTRLVWTNEEGDEGTVVTTVTFEDHGAGTRLVVRDRYPSKEALDAAIESGATSWNPETFDQLDELLVKLGTSTRG
jgi:uncharacterized protein YndB with AHSA1/START domain